MSTPHPREEEAAAYALDLMPPAERIPFTRALQEDPNLRTLVEELQLTAAALAHTPAQAAAPAAVREQVLRRIRQLPQQGSRPATLTSAQTPPHRDSSTQRLGLAAAAALLLSTGYLWLKLDQTEQHLRQAITQLQQNHTEQARLLAQLSERDRIATQLQQELAQATQAHQSAKMQIAMLQSTVADYQQGVAVVVWNEQKQEGILKLEKMPPVEAGRDYQLWVVDSTKKTPVNAGIVRVDEKGFAKVDFKPVVEIDSAQKFAISVEKKGGVPENEGPIILLSP